MFDPALVDAARKKQMEFMRSIGLFEEAPMEDCCRTSDRAPISTKRL